MKHAAALTALGLFLGGIFLSPLNAGEKTGPKIVFNNENITLDKLPSGGHAKFYFEFTNRGEQTLVVGEVKASCGCTQAMASPKEIPAGETGKIDVTFDSHGFAGKIEKEILVESNDPARPRVELKFRVEVMPTLVVEPKIIDFETVHLKTGNPRDLEKYFLVKDMVKSGGRVRFVETDIPFLRTQIESVKDYQTRVRVWLVPRDFRGNFQGLIKILSDSKFYPILVIMVQGEIKD
ncbi:MAG: DUF1573 domain-containing protein [bacterium]|nr:DUF1573 domain-containing protein [bacterium]